MYAPKFQLNKVQRLLKTQGELFHFNRPAKNDFGEPNGETVSIDIRGVYHESSSYVSKTATDATTIRSKASPMLLCLWDDATKLFHTDELSFRGKKYRVNGITNIGEANVAADVSLEEIQNG